MGSRTPIIFSLTTTIDTFFGSLVTVLKTGVMLRKQMNDEDFVGKFFKAVTDQSLKLVHLLCAEFPTVRFAMRIISCSYHRDISDLTLDFSFPHVHNELGYALSPDYIRPYGRPLSSTTPMIMFNASSTLFQGPSVAHASSLQVCNNSSCSQSLEPQHEQLLQSRDCTASWYQTASI